ncbi:glycoside hydrolase family 16 protein [Botrimarina hoheduenensis]|uniref:Beta-glucanase n=1 Tax=Botrimarina hoheduenensis TaxID=2528000 RepID=A0A5C5WAB1_9BACT|nr:glycoside hydrolase family 16 protein [Botrimarina hoheduenensis]TWT47838.1 Beta-glucanase precursor [Botrimarina hoheduenensis]
MIPSDAMYRFRGLLAAFALTAGADFAQAEGTNRSASAAALAADGYTLSWADEFDQDGPPSADNWSFEQGFKRNDEAQWYQSQNAYCENGLLIIEARRERIDLKHVKDKSLIPGWARQRSHAEYTSSSLLTKDKHEWLYGRFEMRAKVPTADGSWPAYWTLGKGRWPACGEIDIMEYYDRSVLANVAWLGRHNKTEWRTVKTPVVALGGPAWAEAFHLWRMDWNADSIELYLDDQLLNRTDTTEIRNANAAADNPFRKPNFLLLNLAIGGEKGGDPSRTVFPLRYEIDYVRVYQRTPHTAAIP